MRRTKHWNAAACLAAATTTLACMSTMAGAHDTQRTVVSPAGDAETLFDAPAPHAGVDRGGTSPGVQAAADHIISLQCPDGGWNWPHGGCSSTFANITGPIGLGLLRAYELVGDPSILDAVSDAADFNMTNVYPVDGEERYSSFQSYFFYRLSQVSGDPTYSDAAATQFFDELDAGTYGDPDYDTAGWIQAVKDGRDGQWINLRPWEFSTIAYTAGQIGNAGQQTDFRDAIIDGLETLDNTDPANVFSDIIGITGGVRGLALINETSFAALNAPNHPIVNGIDDLCDLADALVALQNADGSWYWHSNLASPGESSKDTQTTAYAVLALMAAQDAGCGPYDTEINMARNWIDSMQDVDGGFFSYPGGDHNIEVESEALDAWAAPTMSLSSTSCEPGSTLTVDIDISDMGTLIVGGQFFLSYDNSLLDFVSADPGDSPFTLEVFESVDEGAGTIDYAVGVPGGGPGDMGPATMATLTFNVLGETCQTEALVEWRMNTPPSRLTDMVGTPVLPTLLDLPEVTLDMTPPIIACPDDIMVNADAGGCDAVVDIFSSTTETFDDPVMTSATQAPGVWYTDRYAPFGFTNEMFDGDMRLKHSIDASDCSPCRGGSFNSAFYDTQGRKFDIPGTTKMSIDLYIPSSWATTGRRMAGFWGTAFDSSSSISGFPIIEFTSTDSNPRFRWFTQAGGGSWIDLGLPTGFAYDDWYTLTIELVGGEWIGTVGDLTVTDTLTFGSVEIGNVILQGHNNTAGVTYDIYWDNFTYGTGASAEDNCNVASLIGVRSDSLPLTDPYPQGTTTITWTATDDCGNMSSCTQDVIVSGDNEAIIDLAYDGMLDNPVDRCLEFAFEGMDGPQTVEQVVSFAADGTADAVSVLVPCGDYDCVTVRDPLHSLASSVGLSVSGAQYTAAATGPDAMIGGNFNGDIYVDILDFGVFVGQFMDTLPMDTDCMTAAPHADITGDGLVDSGDFSFIQTNFLEVSDMGCGMLRYAGGAQAHVPAHVAGKGNARPRHDGPVQRISVAELKRRGLGHLTVADLNHDKWLDQNDIAAFLQGAQP